MRVLVLLDKFLFLSLRSLIIAIIANAHEITADITRHGNLFTQSIILLHRLRQGERFRLGHEDLTRFCSIPTLRPVKNVL